MSSDEIDAKKQRECEQEMARSIISRVNQFESERFTDEKFDEFDDKIEEIYNDIQEINEFEKQLNLDFVLNYAELADLCLYYEDLFQNRDDIIQSTLLSSAYYGLKKDSSDYIDFVNFLSKKSTKDKLFSQANLVNYLQKLNTKMNEFKEKLPKMD